MIIRCRKCESSFRFDDLLMAGGGVWVRCGLCKEVFFEDNPHKDVVTSWPQENGLTAHSAGPVKMDWPGLEEDAALRELFRQTESNTHKEPVLAKFTQEMREPEIGGPGSLIKEFGDLGDFASDEKAAETFEFLREPEVAEVKKKTNPIGKFFAYLGLVLFVLIFSGGLALWIFPQSRQEVADSLSPYFPWAEMISGQSQASQALSQVALQDVRQHFVNNWLMGNLRVVEGSVVNRGKYPLTRVQVRGRLYDSVGNIIGEWTSFCGNLLTDAELATLSEEELKRKLSVPPVGNATSDRVNPNGQIPFLVVVVHHDQPAVAKTTVAVTGAEKLL